MINLLQLYIKSRLIEIKLREFNLDRLMVFRKYILILFKDENILSALVEHIGIVIKISRSFTASLKLFYFS